MVQWVIRETVSFRRILLVSGWSTWTWKRVYPFECVNADDICPVVGLASIALSMLA
jgi:hypothetical protein